MAIKSQRTVDHIPTPSITIFARHHQGAAWKNHRRDYFSQDILISECGNVTGALLEECIQEKTFDLNDVVHDANLWYLGGNETIPLMEPKLWTTHFTSVSFGRGYTLRFDWNSSASYDQVFLHLNRSLDYTIFIHDHEYFWASENYLAMTSLFVTIDPSQTTSHYDQMVVTEHQLLENCEPDSGYSFQACVQQVRDFLQHIWLKNTENLYTIDALG